MILAGRLLQMLLGFWFVFLVAEPVPAHDCPMHTPAGISTGAGHGENGHSSHDSKEYGLPHHASGHRTGTDRTTESNETHPQAHNQDQPTAAHFCLCLGCSSGSQSIEAPSTGLTLPIPAQLFRVVKSEPIEAPTSEAPEYLLPPSTAPPLYL